MSSSSDRPTSSRAAKKARKKAEKQAKQDLKEARTAARKAFDLKDPRFLGEAALAATRGPVGLALFGASRGLQVAREKRAEQAELLDNLAADAKHHADAVREHASVLVAPEEKPRRRRRLAPLWVLGLAGGAAVAGAAAYLLREQGPAAPGAGPAASGSAPVDTPDPEGPADQSTDTAPAAAESAAAPSGSEESSAESAPTADSAAPGAAAGTAPQPADDPDEDGASDAGTSDKA